MEVRFEEEDHLTLQISVLLENILIISREI